MSTDIAADTSLELHSTYKSEEWPSVTSEPPSIILSLSEEESAQTAKAQTSESAVNIPWTSTWDADSMSKQKADLRELIARNLSLSKRNIPTQTSDSYSKPTTTQQILNDSVIPPGLQSRDFNGPLGKSYQKRGYNDVMEATAGLEEACARASAKPAKADTHDEGKAPLAQLPWAAVEAMSKVQLYGHKKYKDFHNYRKGMEVSRNLSCALRHIKEYMEGLDSDLESGESPLAHAMCRVAFVLQNIHDKTAIDDRYK